MTKGSYQHNFISCEACYNLLYSFPHQYYHAITNIYYVVMESMNFDSITFIHFYIVFEGEIKRNVFMYFYHFNLVNIIM